MKKLVLGIAIAALTGCTAEVTVEPDPDPIFASLVTVRWDFQSTAGAARSCPTDYPVARVISQALNPSTYKPTGTTYIDDYDCDDGQGTLELPDEDIYVVWVEFLRSASPGAQRYAQSEEKVVDTLLDGDPSFTVKILDDGGYFSLSWELVDAVSGAPLSCSAAGATEIDTISTNVVNQSQFIDDVFRCSNHFGTTKGLRAGTYTVSIDAANSSGALGEPLVIPNAEITAPNGLTYLGLVELPID